MSDTDKKKTFYWLLQTNLQKGAQELVRNAARVTRLDEFSPFRWLFSGSFFYNYLQSKPNYWATFFDGIDYVLILAKKTWLGYILGIFFHQLIWSPWTQPRKRQFTIDNKTFPWRATSSRNRNNFSKTFFYLRKKIGPSYPLMQCSIFSIHFYSSCLLSHRPYHHFYLWIDSSLVCKCVAWQVLVECCCRPGVRVILKPLFVISATFWKSYGPWFFFFWLKKFFQPF
jgi:hypothetical protein